jgi:hypothetical protein
MAERAGEVAIRWPPVTAAAPVAAAAADGEEGEEGEDDEEVVVTAISRAAPCR